METHLLSRLWPDRNSSKGKKVKIMVNRMKLVSSWVNWAILVMVLVCLFANSAFAQVPSPVPADTLVSALTWIGMVLGLILGFVNHGIASGTIVIWKVPPPSLPYLSIGAVFLTAFVPQLQQMTAFSWNGFGLAFFVGVSALVSYTAGATVAAHAALARVTGRRVRDTPHDGIPPFAVK